jgi:crotonobetainyl-CoA:carnitine CoA-transferase CaiB-like acyl-CoA transferase
MRTSRTAPRITICGIPVTHVLSILGLNAPDLPEFAAIRPRAWPNLVILDQPGLPWRASFGCTTGPAPELGADSDHVLADVLGLSQGRIVELRTSGALG